MPNLITHTIFAEEALNLMQNTKYKKWIEKHKEEYKIGTNGPDFLFFYDIFPLLKKRDARISKIGSKMHKKKINLFYETAIKAYQDIKEKEIKEAATVYLIGHYLHWQLDSIMHPYVVYKTGFNDPRSIDKHHRLESMMDTILLKRLRNTTIQTYKTYEICNRSLLSVKAIASFYIPCIKTCFKEDINEEIIEKSLIDWQKVQKVLYDPKGKKFKTIQILENMIHHKWLLSSQIVRNEMDNTYDIMNDNHQVWHHPCTNETFDKSVMDLFQEALKNSKIGIPLLITALETGNSDAFLKFIGDKTYANGISGDQERIYKNVIYK